MKRAIVAVILVLITFGISLGQDPSKKREPQFPEGPKTERCIPTVTVRNVPIHSIIITTFPSTKGARIHYMGPDGSGIEGDLTTEADGTATLTPKKRPKAAVPPVGNYSFTVDKESFLTSRSSYDLDWKKESYAINALLQPDTQSILVAMGKRPQAIRNSLVRLDGKDYPPENLIRDEKKGFITLKGVHIGNHSLEITHNTLAPYKQENFPVTADAPFIAPDEFIDAISRITIRTQPDASIILDGVAKGIAINGLFSTTLPYDEKTHTIAATKLAFETSAAEFQLEPGKDIERRIDLTPIVSFDNLIEGWTQGFANWQKPPASWSINQQSSILTVNGTGVAYTAKQFQDFTAEFTFQFGEGRGVAWVVRGQDDKNCYLFELLKPAGNSQNMILKRYKYLDGSVIALSDVPIYKTYPLAAGSTVSKPFDIGANEQINIRIEAQGDELKHYITVPRLEPDTARNPVDSMVDSNRPLRYGRFGFVAMEGETFEILPPLRISVVKPK